jgi:ubiquinone/menaquinone biosynthesis C-methylase UbiE
MLDWLWTLEQIDRINGKTILDAGAGIGFLQWYLASKGAQIISVDRSDRTCIPFHLLNQFNVRGLTSADIPLSTTELLNLFNGKAPFFLRLKAIMRGILGKLKFSQQPSLHGTVSLYRKELNDLADIPDNSVDFVVSISALEHNAKIDDIKEIISELQRVLKPSGKMIITLPASYEKDWFFEPAYSWCFTDATIKDIFEIAENTSSNFNQYNTIAEEIKNSTELKNNLSWRYYFHKNSGMPQGKWDPKYLPVGVVKTKQEIGH